MAEVKNTFLKGRMNQDLDSRILPEGEYREAINLLISRSEGNTVGEFENVLGNIQIPSSSNLSNTQASVIGHVVDETNNRGFFLLTTFSNQSISSRATSTDTCLVLEVSFDSPFTIKVLVEGYFLNFNKCFPVTGINFIENLLFWTDNFNQPRKINIDLANPSSSANPTYYTEESQISVAKYYPFQPLLPLVRNSAVINSGSSTTSQLVFDTDQTNIKVGDLITDNDKSPGVTEKFTVPTRVTKINSLQSFSFSPALGSPLPSNFKVDFSRSSMENKYEQFDDNYSLNNQAHSYDASDNSFVIQETGSNNEKPNYGGLPRIGDIVVAGDATVNGVTNTALNKIGGNLVGPLTAYITQNSVNAADGSYPSATYSTSGNGSVATIDVTVAGNTVTAVTVTAAGYGFVVGDTITVGTSVIGGSTNLIITLTAVNITETRISGFILGTSKPALAVTVNPYRWEITLDHPAGINGGKPSTDYVSFAKNPDYDQEFKGDSKFLEDKFVRFSYRFNYIDGEESLMAPFSQVMFIPKQHAEFGRGQLVSTEDLGSPSVTYPIYNDDCDDAYKSTIIRWFENNIDSIGLKIPVPESSSSLLSSNLLIKSIDILYKESDALVVKVLDTVDVEDISSLSTISYNDVIHGNVDQKYYDYQYKSTKPYKTLTQGATTRVFDKVPVKALAQEIITNRVVYGNFVEKMTPPENIPYSITTADRNVVFDNYTQYPFHNLKQNRTYQVGFVLADYYGRQSSVVLSSFDSDNSKAGSSIYLPYRTLGDATSSPVIDWLGKALNVTINQSIGENNNAITGEPGIYKAFGNVGSVTTLDAGGTGYTTDTVYQTSYSGNGTGCTVRIKSGGVVGGVIQTASDIIIVTSGKNYSNGDTLDIVGSGASSGQITINIGESNPLGWYTYKIVVQQQEQDYYNVFTPGLINGLPVWGSAAQGLERNKFCLTTVAGENVNKIPRSLRTVGATDTEFNSEEILYLRVTNKDATSYQDASDATGARTGNAIPWNSQYYPGQLSQNVLTIATMRDTEYGAIPFVAYSAAAPGVLGHQGEYGSTVTTVPISTAGGSQTTQPTGSIPWGDVGKAASFYAQEQNPFVVKINTTANADNQVGANVVEEDAWNGNNIPSGATQQFAMQPFLAVVETKPVESLLGLFYETSMSGKLEILNSGIDFGNPGVVSSTLTSIDFPESTNANANVGTAFRLISGEGPTITSSTGLTVSISRVVRQSAPNTPIQDADGNPDLFSISLPTGTGELQLSTKPSTYFWYGTSSAVVNSSTDIYTVTLDCSRVSGGVTYNSTIDILLNLTNVAPTITDADLTTPDANCNCTVPACPINITTATENIKTFYAINGSVDPANKTQELVWSLGTITVDDGSSTVGVFSIDSESGALTAAAGTLSDDAVYNIDVIVTDVSGAGLSATCTTNLQVGYERSPNAICTGVNLSLSDTYKALGCNYGAVEYLFANTTDQNLTAGGCCYPLALGISWDSLGGPTKLINMGVIYAAGTCRADLFQGTIRFRGVLKGEDASCIGDASMKWFIQYRSNNVSPWGDPPTNAGSYQGTTYPTDGVPLSISGNGEDKGSSVSGSGTFYSEGGGWFFFDAVGEYRVLAGNIAGDFCGTCGGTDKVKFYLEYGDGYYNTCTGSPCTP